MCAPSAGEDLSAKDGADNSIAAVRQRQEVGRSPAALALVHRA